MPISKTYAARLKRLRRQMKIAGVASFLVTKFENVTYLTGFSGDDSFLLVTPREPIILSDFRYVIQIQEECPGFEVEIRRQGVSLVEFVGMLVQRLRIKVLGIEAESMVVSQFETLKGRLKTTTLAPTSGVVESLRAIKDRTEIEQIRRSVSIAQRAFRAVRSAMCGHETEKQIAGELEFQIRRFDGEGCSFDPIVAVGPRAALPHAVPTRGRITERDFVLIDWGANWQGYASDLTRVLVTGRISPKLERVYRVVLAAQLAAIKSIHPGARMCDVDAAARTVIEKAGFGKRFGHGLGHGIGLEIHEAPRLAVGQERPLEVGMVVTVEPGIYLPRWGGVRIEDDVLVTSDGHETLSNLPKELEACIVD